MNSPRSTPVLDAQIYPHLLDLIVDLADYDALLPLRGTSSAIRHRVDAILCTHLVVRSPPSQRTPGAYYYTLFRSNHPLPLPVFAQYEYTADEPFTLSAPQAYDDDAGGAWGWSAWGTHSHSRRGTAPALQTGAFRRHRTPGEMGRAWDWCAAALKKTRTLKVYGRALDTRQQADLLAAGGLGAVHTVRVYPDARGRRVFRVLVPAPNLVVTLSLRLGADLRPSPATIPDFTGAVERLTLLVDFYERYGHDDALVEGFAFPPALREVTIILDGRNGDVDEATPHPRMFGVLAQVLGNAVPHLHRVRVTLVGVDPESGPMLGLEHDFDPETEPMADGSPPAYADVEEMHWDDICGLFKDRLLAQVERQVRARGQGDVARAVGNLRVMTHQEWAALRE
jgi:hypothetical protein